MCQLTHISKVLLNHEFLRIMVSLFIEKKQTLFEISIVHPMKLLHLNLFLIDIHLNMEILHTLQMYLLQFIMN